MKKMLVVAVAVTLSLVLVGSAFAKGAAYGSAGCGLAAQLQTYIDLGITHFILRFADFPKTAGAELFIKEVLPRFSA